MKIPSATSYRPTQHFFCVGLASFTFLLLFAGGMVTSTNSGLSVPDWPTTFGKNMFLFPPSMMQGGIFYEHGHRLFASLVGLLTVVNCAAFWIWDKRKWLQWTGVVAILLVLIQGVLGGLTVKFKLPMLVSVAHACTAELFFMLTLFMAFVTSKAYSAHGANQFRLKHLEQFLSLLFCLFVFVQILVGAVMRHSYAGLAIPTFPLAFGQIVPPFWNFGIIVHFLHTRVGAPLLVLSGLVTIFSVTYSSRSTRATKGLASFLAIILLVQCLLGMITVWSGKAPIPTTFHLSIGALVFGTGFLIFLMTSTYQNGNEDILTQSTASDSNNDVSQLQNGGVVLS